MNIENNKVVMFNYVLKDKEGNVLDDSKGEPMPYLHGHENIIPGLEKEMAGKIAGDNFNLTVGPGEAYGDINPELVQELPKADFPEDEQLEIGMQFHVDTDKGPIVVTVNSITDETVTVDGNHPMAGMTLTFEIKISEVRDASEDELKHGHVHGEGCNH